MILVKKTPQQKCTKYFSKKDRKVFFACLEIVLVKIKYKDSPSFRDAGAAEIHMLVAAAGRDESQNQEENFL